MPLPAIPFLATFVGWIMTFIYRFLISEVILFLLGFGLIFFAEEIQDFIKKEMLDPINNFFDSKLDQTENFIFLILSSVKNLITPALDLLITKVDQVFNINIDNILSYPATIAIIDEYINTILTTINATIVFYVESLLNPVSESINQSIDDLNSIRTSIENVFNSINSRLIESWNNATQQIQEFIDTVNLLIDAVHIFLNEKDLIAEYAASKLTAGTTIDDAFILSFKSDLSAYVNARTNQLEIAASKSYLAPDLSFPDSLLIDHQTIADILADIGGIIETLNYSADLVNGLIASLQNYITTVFAIQIRLNLEAFAKEFFIVAWAIKFDEFRTELNAETRSIKTNLDHSILEKKQSVVSHFTQFKTDLVNKENELISKITPDLIKPRFVRLTEKLEDHASQAQDLMKNINIGEYIDDLNEVDSILVSLPDMKHEQEPAYKVPRKMNIKVLYRLLINYASRAERIALAITIAENDMKLDAKTFYENTIFKQ